MAMAPERHTMIHFEDEVKARANIVIGDNESTSIAEFIYRQLL